VVNMKVKDIIEEKLKALGADGLCNSDEQCGCGVCDLAPCECLNLDECVAAKFIKPKKEEVDYMEEWPEGYYMAI
jgi:hypothetical protein